MLFLLLAAALVCLTCSRAPEYDLVIRGGTIYDGSGGPPFIGDVVIKNDTIALIGNAENLRGSVELVDCYDDCLTSV